MKRKIIDYLQDILVECNYLIKESKKIDYSSFIENENLKRAFVRSLEIIGEASKKIPKTIQNTYSEINWREVKGMRDKLIHEYFGIDYKVVWKTIKEDIPNLKEVIEKILESFKENE
ncbi:MAG: DUF86 domain-containing protein [candidate division WOR-3 bacterium]